MKLSDKGSALVSEFIQQHKNDPKFQHLEIRDMLNHFVKQGIVVNIQYITGHWVNVNNIVDLNLASNF